MDDEKNPIIPKKRVNLTLPVDLLDRMHRIKERKKISISGQIELALRSFLSRLNGEKNV